MGGTAYIAPTRRERHARGERYPTTDGREEIADDALGWTVNPTGKDG
jgi:hypothetical protein